MLSFKRRRADSQPRSSQHRGVSSFSGYQNHVKHLSMQIEFTNTVVAFLFLVMWVRDLNNRCFVQVIVDKGPEHG